MLKDLCYTFSLNEKIHITEFFLDWKTSLFIQLQARQRQVTLLKSAFQRRLHIDDFHGCVLTELSFTNSNEMTLSAVLS